MASSLRERRILVVDDELAIRRALQQRLAEEGAEVETADNVAMARSKVQAGGYDLLIFDHRLPDGTGLRLLEELREADCHSAAIMMTAYSSTQDAVRAIKAGAADYVMKPFDLDEMVIIAERTVEHQRLQREVDRFRARDRAVGSIGNLVGESPAIQELREFLGRVAESGAPTVLICGESGTGKDVVARAIHYSSDRADKPLLTINCTALPEALLESELFGHEKGAFTDAKQTKKGLFEEADGGTIFLDEIGDMPLALQGKLLRFLESKSFRRLGGLREIKVDVHVVAATNRELPGAIEQGSFRSDLFYRLNVIPIEMPPLRERLSDVPLLVQHFADQFSRELRKPVQGFDAEALAVLSAYQWPGNVRELRNSVERAVLLSREPVLHVSDLSREIRRGAGVDGSPGAHHPDRPLVLPEEGVHVDSLLKDLLDQALERTHGNKSRAALLLGIHRDQVRYWVKKYELERWIRRAPRASANASASSSDE